MSNNANQEWGPCKDCKWWQIEPEAEIADETLGYCIEEKLQPFLLSVTGNSGCNQFTEGSPVRAAGASDQPPKGKPQR
jgi:hypothetical protein